MSPKRTAVRDRLKDFQSKWANSDPVLIQKSVQEALSDRHYLIVKHAALRCEEHLLYDLEADLLAAYRRMLKNPVKSDPHCTAKGAIARTLVALDCQEIDFFIAGLHYQQHEPVWGGTEDSAVDLRASCAIGLVNTSYPRALIELVTLLYDPYAGARKAAVRAISFTQPLAAEAVLRAKSLAGDSDPDITGETLSALLQVSPSESLEFVARFLDASDDPALRESIALALGASKIDEALQVLRMCWDKEPLKQEQDVLLLGAVLHRSEKALAWLLEVVSEGDRVSAKFVLEQLATHYRTNEKLGERLQTTLAGLQDKELTAFFRKIWR